MLDPGTHLRKRGPGPVEAEKHTLLNLKDRFTRGFIAGFVAGSAMSVFSWLSYHVLDWTELRYLDWAAVVLYGRKPITLDEVLFAQLGHLFFAGLVGVGFAFLIPRVTSMNFLLKSLVYSTFIWFMLYSVAIAYKMPFLSRISLESASSNLVGAIIYGLVLGPLLKYLDDRLRSPL